MAPGSPPALGADPGPAGVRGSIFMSGTGKVALEPYSTAQSSKFAVYVWAQAEPSAISYCEPWVSVIDTWPCWTPLMYQLPVAVGFVVSYLMSSVYQVFAETVVPA